ncbi:MAG: hypothetical protein IIB54_05915 [Planctomycetes bacterium]|nr:hypothetical protein [Planctomycetota bacterium]
MFRPVIVLAATLNWVFTSLAIVVVLVLIGRDLMILPEDLEEPALASFERQRWRHHSPDAWQDFTPGVLDYHWAGGRKVWIVGVKNRIKTEDLSSPEWASQWARQKAIVINIEQYGWPFLCAYKERWNQKQGSNIVVQGENVFVIGSLRLPSRIMGLGLIGNTLIYGAFAWVILMSIVLTRRWNRLRSGRCPNCAYFLQDRIADGCPECGWNRS